LRGRTRAVFGGREFLIPDLRLLIWGQTLARQGNRAEVWKEERTAEYGGIMGGVRGRARAWLPRLPARQAGLRRPPALRRAGRQG
jgi:hypothetical protein